MSFLRWLRDFINSILNSPPAPSARAPWHDWIKRHIGEIEQTGGPITDFGKEIFSHTDYTDPIKSGIMAAGCAATLCAALEETGFKSPHDASAISFKDYGIACDLKQDCILVFEWAPGEHHVTTCDEIIDAISVKCLGGNQSHRVQDSIYPRSSIIAIRWPVK